MSRVHDLALRSVDDGVASSISLFPLPASREVTALLVVIAVLRAVAATDTQTTLLIEGVLKAQLLGRRYIPARPGLYIGPSVLEIGGRRGEVVGCG